MTLHRSIRDGIAVAIILFMTVHASAAQNQNAAPEFSSKEKIRFIQDSFDKGEANARIWLFSWVYISAGLSVAGYSLFATYYMSSDKAAQVRWVTYAAAGVRSSLNLGMLLIQGLPTVFAGKNLALMPEGTPDQVNKKLAEAERLLAVSAGHERSGHTWLPHTLSLLVNATGGLVIWKCQKNRKSWQDALLYFTTGMAVSEIQIWTMPTSSIKALNDYRKKYYGMETGESNDPYEAKWFVNFTGNGIAAGTYF